GELFMADDDAGAAHALAGKYAASQSRSTFHTRVEFSLNKKWSSPLNKCNSAGWPARLNISTDCSVGVTESLAAWMRRSGRGAILLTTSSARKSNMLCAVSAGNVST